MILLVAISPESNVKFAHQDIRSLGININKMPDGARTCIATLTLFQTPTVGNGSLQIGVTQQDAVKLQNWFLDPGNPEDMMYIKL